MTSGIYKSFKKLTNILTAFFDSIKINLRKYIDKVAQPFEKPQCLIVQSFECFLLYNQKYGVEKD